MYCRDEGVSLSDCTKQGWIWRGGGYSAPTTPLEIHQSLCINSTAHSCITFQSIYCTNQNTETEQIFQQPTAAFLYTILHQTIQWDISHATAMSFNRHVPLTSWVTVEKCVCLWLSDATVIDHCAGYAHSIPHLCPVHVHFQTYFAHNRPLKPTWHCTILLVHSLGHKVQAMHARVSDLLGFIML